ncbi:hypothetical protein Tco_0831643 [Tanacetum coccineum]
MLLLLSMAEYVSDQLGIHGGGGRIMGDSHDLCSRRGDGGDVYVLLAVLEEKKGIRKLLMANGTRMFCCSFFTSKRNEKLEGCLGLLIINATIMNLYLNGRNIGAFVHNGLCWVDVYLIVEMGAVKSLYSAAETAAEMGRFRKPLTQSRMRIASTSPPYWDTDDDDDCGMVTDVDIAKEATMRLKTAGIGWRKCDCVRCLLKLMRMVV